MIRHDDDDAFDERGLGFEQRLELLFTLRNLGVELVGGGNSVAET